jgi:hypothetical protein
MDGLSTTWSVIKLIGQVLLGAVLLPVKWVWRKVAGK